MNLIISNRNKICKGEVKISGSKSESNRLLLLKAFFSEIEIINISNSDDSVAMINALSSNDLEIDVHHAGTAMRFLTAFYSTQPNKNIILTGSDRMKERPIGVLVKALNKIGSDIIFEKKKGFPPLRINGKTLEGGKISLPANISSQYISAILLIAPFLKNGISLTLTGKVTSLPYIKMTISLLKKIGVVIEFKENLIRVENCRKIINNKIIVESDWSSASYFYSCAALSSYSDIKLTSFFKESLQGDSKLIEIYQKLGVSTVFNIEEISLKKINNFILPESFEWDLIETPDLAQTIAVTCFGLGVKCDLYGLHTLKIKETDRLEALNIELTKMGAKVLITDNSIHVLKSKKPRSGQKIKTYNDHRMALAFSPLAIKTPIQIESSEVVSKSFPSFWIDMQNIGFQVVEK